MSGGKPSDDVFPHANGIGTLVKALRRRSQRQLVQACGRCTPVQLLDCTPAALGAPQDEGTRNARSITAAGGRR
jgi:hypothetical protein